MSKKKTTEEWIKEAKLRHNNIYDYSKSEYIGANQLITIICKKHGEFQQNNNSHLAGHGCPKCKNERNKLKFNSWENGKFLQKAKIIYGDQYEYLECINNKVKIKCKKHDIIFYKLKSKLLSGSMCPECTKEITKRGHDTEWFIRESKKIYGDKYKYDKTIYSGIKNKVIISCSKHGDFEKSPEHFLAGQGCKQCSNEKKSFNSILNEKEFWLRIQKVHGTKYDYSNSKYEGCFKKIKVFCPLHGEFEIGAGYHAKGGQCPHCWASKGEARITAILIENNIKFEKEKKFKDLGLKRFDFFIPSLNFCIEYMGIQHYEIRKHFHMTNESLKQLQETDKLKKDYCIQNKIKYFSIPYWEFNNLEYIIKRLLKNKIPKMKSFEEYKLNK